MAMHKVRSQVNFQFLRIRRNTSGVVKICLILVMLICLNVAVIKIANRLLSHMEVEVSQLAEMKRHGKMAELRMNPMPAKKDWHNYEFIEQEAARTGMGEQGKPGFLPASDDDLKDKLYRSNGFNGLLSDKISVNRSIRDTRPKECKAKTYLAKLPTVSVVIPFLEEQWSVLLRTVYSLLNRSPPELLKEIILVDDASKRKYLKAPLDDYVRKHLPKVKVVRLKERQGLIKARIEGAKIATGEVLVILDSHVEANVNWLPPLLEPIAENYRVCMCPSIDVVSHKDFEYRTQGDGARGGFDWLFFYKTLPRPKEDIEKHPTKPFASPVMAGGLFAISTKFFWELGGYDEGLDIWGGEQFELSFKIWQCGGAMYDAPCSKVGHIYRGPRDYQGSPRTFDYMGKNFKRVAEVWMDEYKEFLYDRQPEKFRNLDAGDLTKQLAIREKLQCKPFKWFMENVAPDFLEKYPPVEPPDYANGAIQNVYAPHLCVDAMNQGVNGVLGMYYCTRNLKDPQYNQNWALSFRKDIRQRFSDKCWDVSTSVKDAPIVLFYCHLMGGNQYFSYDPDTKMLKQGKNNRCLDCNPETMKVFINNCAMNKDTMKWNWATVNETAFAEWKAEGQ